MNPKPTLSRPVLWTTLIVLGLVVLSLQVWAGDKPTAEVTFVEGKAEIQQGRKGKTQALKVGDKLTKKHYVSTGEKSKVEIKLPDGSIIRVAPSSKVRMRSLLADKKGKKRDVGIKLQAGKIWANVSKAIGSDSKFEVETDNAVAGVRGTIFRVDRADNDVTVVKVYTGAVAVSNAPIYQKKGHTKANRVEVPGPRQVTKRQYEELLAKALQEIRVAANGELSEPASFDPQSSIEKTEWAAWNQERDRLLEQ